MFLVSSCSCLRWIHWSQVLSWEWRWSWSSADRRCSNYIWVINNFIAYKGATYIRGFTGHVFGMALNRRQVTAWLIELLNKNRVLWRIYASTDSNVRSGQSISRKQSTHSHLSTMNRNMDFEFPLQWRHNERDGASNHRFAFIRVACWTTRKITSVVRWTPLLTHFGTS